MIIYENRQNGLCWNLHTYQLPPNRIKVFKKLSLIGPENLLFDKLTLPGPALEFGLVGSSITDRRLNCNATLNNLGNWRIPAGRVGPSWLLDMSIATASRHPVREFSIGPDRELPEAAKVERVQFFEEGANRVSNWFSERSTSDGPVSRL
jgi:hypothetical protein